MASGSSPITTRAATQCPLCNGGMDCYGDHLVGCPRNEVARRHRALLNLISKYASQAGMPHVIKITIPIPGKGQVTLPSLSGMGEKGCMLTSKWDTLWTYQRIVARWSREETTKEKETKYQRIVNLDEFWSLVQPHLVVWMSMHKFSLKSAGHTQLPHLRKTRPCHLNQQLLMVLNKEVARMLRSALPQ